MVIQCSSCDTRFKIADDKVKAGGVKVRCSKCKEVFTVLPPEEEQAAAPAPEETPAPETPAADWGDMNATFSEESATAEDSESGTAESSESATGLDDVDWSSLGGDETPESEPATTEEAVSSNDFSFGEDEEEATSSDDFSFGDEEEATASSDDFAFDDAEETASSDDFSFGDEEPAADDADSDISDAFSFGGDDSSGDESAFDEPVGEGAQDEFSFDDEPAASDAADDFDWDGDSSADADSGDGGFGFADSEKSSDSLDFSSLEMAEDEAPAVEVEAAQPAATPPPEPLPLMDDAKPSSVKGPQKKGPKGRGAKRRKAKKKSGPLRTLLALFLLLILLLGGGLFGLQQMGIWSGDFAELSSLDYVAAGETAWEKAKIQFHKIVGNEEALVPAGTFSIKDENVRYVQTKSSGLVFIIEGKVQNDHATNQSAIAVLGKLYDANGAVVKQQKVFCGNLINDETLNSDSLKEEIQKGVENNLGFSLSNYNVAPGTSVPFMIVFTDLPENLQNYTVEPAASGTKQ